MTTLSPEMIDAMVAAGLTAEQMAAIMKAQLAAQAAADEARRAAKRDQATERQRRKRERDQRTVTHVTRDSALQGVTERDLPSDGSPKDITQTPSLPPISSDADASDDAAAPSPAALPPIDQVWLKVSDMSDLSGRKPETVRSWIGKALKDYPPETVLKGMSEAMKAKSGDPFAYAKRVMMGATDPPHRVQPESKKPSVQDAARELLEQFRRGAGSNDRVLALSSGSRP